MKLPLLKPAPDIERFKKTVLGEITPQRPPFAELFLDEGMVKLIGEKLMGLHWAEPVDLQSRKAYWDFKIKVYHALGYDYLWVFGAPAFPVKPRSGRGGGRIWAETNKGPIQSFEDFYDYPWPSLTDEMLWHYYYVSEHLPDGMGMFVANGDGFLEIVTNFLIGYESMCFMLYDNPDLVNAVVDKVGGIIFDSCVKMLEIPRSSGVFMGDDMGFNSSMLFSADFYRRLILPWHKKLAKAVHNRTQLYMLHSCGKIDEIMPDLICNVGIDAKHSFQAGYYDVCDYKRKYGKEIAILGGVDVDMLCRLDEASLRKYVRTILDICAPDGRYALGTGNSVTDYIPLRNYLAMLDEGLKFSL